MDRLFAGLVAVLLLTLAPHASLAFPSTQKPLMTAGGPITLVEGWWEREHRDDARDRYWKLPSDKRRQYDRLQAQTRAHDEQRRRHAIEEQHRLLAGDSEAKRRAVALI